MAWWAKALDYISAPLSNPKTLLTKGWTAAAKKVKVQRKGVSAGTVSPWKIIGTTLTSTAVIGGGVLAVAGAGAGGVAGGVARSFVTKTLPTVAKKAIPKSITGRVAVAVATPTIIGGVVKSPGKAVGTLIEAPSELAEFGGDLAKFGYNPSLESAKNIVKGSPLLSGALAGGAILATAPITIPAIGGVLTRDRLGDIEKAISAPPVGLPSAPGAEKPLGAPTTLIQPKTTKISATRKRYKRRTKKAPSIRNSVRVNIVNSPRVTGLSMKRYIKQSCLA